MFCNTAASLQTASRSQEAFQQGHPETFCRTGWLDELRGTFLTYKRLLFVGTRRRAYTFQRVQQNSGLRFDDRMALDVQTSNLLNRL
jgi:hypothetical protein